MPSDKNPADLASRGSSVSELITSNWITSPHFLWEKEISKAVDVIREIPIGDPEVKRVLTMYLQSMRQVTLLELLSKFVEHLSEIVFEYII